MAVISGHARVGVGHCPRCERPIVVTNDHEVWPVVDCSSCGWEGGTTQLLNRVRLEAGGVIKFPDGRPLSDPAAPTMGKFTKAGPDTSRLAALAVYPKTPTQRRRILEIMLKEEHHPIPHPDGGTMVVTGWTDDEAEQRLGMLHTSYTARRGELVTGGWVYDSGRRRKTRSGNEAVVWKLTAVGKARITEAGIPLPS